MEGATFHHGELEIQLGDPTHTLKQAGSPLPGLSSKGTFGERLRH